jgi:hypothetical protein
MLMYKPLLLQAHCAGITASPKGNTSGAGMRQLQMLSQADVGLRLCFQQPLQQEQRTWAERHAGLHSHRKLLASKSHLS